MTPRSLLIRQAFFGLFHSEALSEAGVENYRTWIISIAVAFCMFHWQLARILFAKYVIIAQNSDYSLFRSVLAADELFYFSAGFLLITLVIALQWQSLFPGVKDFHVLSPLPLRRSDIFLSRLAALGLFLSIFLVTFNLLPALFLPLLTLGPFPTEPLWQSLLSNIASSLGAGIHACLSVMALQGICLVALPRNWRSSASFALQCVLVITVVALIPVVWHLPGLHRLLDTRAAWIGWIPTGWWMGVCETLRGSSDAWHNLLAQRAAIALGSSVAVAAASYLYLYRNFSDIASPSQPVAPRPSPLRVLATRDDGGVLAFIAWTLARSPQHRIILSVIGTVGASLALDGFLSGYLRQWSRGRDPHSLFAETSAAIPLLLAFSLLAALRMTFRIPQEWRAHWIFKITETDSTRADQLEATATAMYWFAVAPSSLVALPFQWMMLGPAETLWCAPLLFGINACLLEHTLKDWQRLPFTSTYAPGHQPAAMSFAVFLALFTLYGSGGAAFVRYASATPFRWLITAAVLTLLVALLRRRRRANLGHEPYSFAEDGDPAVFVTNFAPE